MLKVIKFRYTFRNNIYFGGKRRYYVKYFFEVQVKCLRKGGILILECPDVRELARMNLPDREFIKRLYGGQDYPENFHYAGFTMQTMKELLIKCGLKIESCSHIVGNLHIKAQK